MELEFGNVGFSVEGGKPGEPGEKPSEQGREPTTNSSCGALYYTVQGVSNFDSVDEIRKCDHSDEGFLAVLSCGTVYLMLYKMVLTFESVDEILKCEYLSESSLPVLWYCPSSSTR